MLITVSTLHWFTTVPSQSKESSNEFDFVLNTYRRVFGTRSDRELKRIRPIVPTHPMPTNLSCKA